MDTLDDDLRPLSEIPSLGWIPRRRGGRRIHKSTLFRWASHGLRGVILETVSVGGTLCCNRIHLRTFFAELACIRRSGKASAKRKKQRKRTRAVLERAGVHEAHATPEVRGEAE